MTDRRETVPPITSVSHPTVRHAHSLFGVAGRRRHGAFLVEGRRIVTAAAEVAPPTIVMHTPTFVMGDAGARALIRRLHSAGSLVREVSEEVLTYLCDTVQPQGVVAVVSIPDVGSGKIRPDAMETPGLTLVLDGISDPGNVGTLLRVSAAVGARVLATVGTADVWSPKVVRAGAGAHFVVPVQAGLRWDEVLSILSPGTRIVSTDSNGNTPFWDCKMTGPIALVVSNEAHGATDDARRLAHETIRIPLLAGDSLNAAVAGSVVLYEAIRQRERTRNSVRPEDTAWT